MTWAVAPRPATRAQLAALHPGDRVSGTWIATADGTVQVTDIRPQSIPVGAGTRLLALLGPLAALLVLARLLVPGGIRWLVIGEDNRFSNSKTQAALWFLTLMSAYLATVALRWAYGGPAFAGGVNVQSNLLWLSGISALTFVGAKQIVASRIDSSPVAAARLKPRSHVKPRLRDLVTDDSGTRGDFGDFQMLVLTLIAVGIYAVTVYGWLGHVPLYASVAMPDVDSTLLGTFGVGQAAYLGKKLAGDTGVTAAPGPVTDQTPPRPPFVALPIDK